MPVFPVFCDIPEDPKLASCLLYIRVRQVRTLDFPFELPSFPPGTSKGIFFAHCALPRQTSERHAAAARLASSEVGIGCVLRSFRAVALLRCPGKLAPRLLYLRVRSQSEPSKSPSCCFNAPKRSRRGFSFVGTGTAVTISIAIAGFLSPNRRFGKRPL